MFIFEVIFITAFLLFMAIVCICAVYDPDYDD